MPYPSRWGFAVLFGCLASTTVLFAQQDIPPGSRIRPIPLLVSESVQKEIELTDDQKAKVTGLHAKFQEEVSKFATELTEGKSLRDLSDEHRAKYFAGLRKINDDFEPKTKEILKPEQFERAQQIAYQVQRSQAFRNPDVIKALELTAEQQEKIETAFKEYLDRYRTVASNDTPGDPEKSVRLAKVSDDYMAELVKLLTKEQAKKWEALRGKPFDLTTIRLGGAPLPGVKKP